MSLLGTSQLRFLTRTPWSTLTVLIGMTLGVASVVAVHQISLRVTDSLQAATPPHLAGLTHLLEARKPSTSANDYFDLRARWRSGELPGVRAMLPIVEGQLVIGGRGTMVFAADWIAAAGVPADVGGSGIINAAPSGSDALVASASLGLAVDDTLEIGGRVYTVASIFDGGGRPALFTDIGTGQDLLGLEPTAVSYVGVVKADPLRSSKRALESLMPGISAGFNGTLNEWRLEGWRVRPVAAELPTLAFARSVIFNLGALGSLGLVVAWFLIYQVGVIWHRRRRPLMDRLFAMGVTRRELTRGFVAAFAVLGAVATVLGLAGGLLLARVLSEISTAGLDMPGSLSGVSRWVALKAALSGVLVSCAGGWIACRREWARADGSTAGPWGAWLVPAGLLAVLATGVLLPASGLVGGFAAVLGVSLLVVFSVRPLLENLRAAATRIPGRLLTRIGLREVTWYPRDLSIAIGALSLAVATSMGVGLMVDSFRDDFSAMLDQRLARDLFVDGDGADLAPLLAWLQAQPDAEQVQAYGRSRERLQGHAVELGFTRFSLAESARYGMPRELLPDEVMVSERLTDLLKLDVGDKVALRGRQLEVAAVFRGFGDAGYRLLVDEATARSLGVGVVYDRLSITLSAAHQDDHELAGRLFARFGPAYASLDVQARGAMRRLALDIFDRTFAITTALTLLALLVAVIGMYNALLALRLNQTPSYRLLGALGVGAAEQRRIALLRAGAVGLLAASLALPLGIAMAWLLCNVINPRAFGWGLNLQLDPGEILVPLGLGLLAALVAGLLPMPAEGDLSVDQA